jgi:hypothetical protein
MHWAICAAHTVGKGVANKAGNLQRRNALFEVGELADNWFL